jgi:hypothetical protein
VLEKLLHWTSAIAVWLIVLTVLSSAFYPLSIADENTAFRKQYRMFLISQWLKTHPNN